MQFRAYSYLRMSTDIQLKGDSRRRQLEASSSYAEAHGLELAKEDQLEDIGISAFKGANVKEGALGRFLEAIESGSVPKGSYLLVESLDRISRQKISAGLSLFLRIINAGINVVTLTDKRVYRAGEPDLTDLIVSLVTMSRAHEESVVKSQRLGAAWKNKREQASSGRPMTKWAPAWLKLSSDRKAYEIIPERAEIVKRIYREAASGLGMYTIAGRLNAEGTPTFNQSNGWHQSYIAKILQNRATIGEFQPCVRDDKNHRVPEGAAVQGYYPPIIDESLYFRAQHGKEQRKGKAAGRKGRAFANLFSGLATCAYCGSLVSYENKGSGPKGGAYLICNNARRKLGCGARRWRYQDFEASFLAFVQELDLRSLLSAAEDSQIRTRLEAEIEAIQGELTAISKLMDQTYALLSSTGTMEFISDKLKELDAKRGDLSSRLSEKEAEKIAFQSKEERFQTGRDEINTLVTALQGAPTSELYKLRAQIASRLRAIVASLRIAPLGNLSSPELLTTPMGEIMNRPDHEVLQIITMMAEFPGDTRPYFAVGFENAATRIVYPQNSDPLSYDIQVEAMGGVGFRVR